VKVKAKIVFIILFFFLALPGETAAQQTAAALPALPIPQCFGVNVHFYEKNISRHVEYLKKAGFGWVRIDFSWDRVEREKGMYDFSVYDEMFSELDDAGIRILAILDYGNPNYDGGLSPASEEARKGFAAFAAAAAKRYADMDIVWEIYNEPNIVEFWKPRPDAGRYAALAEEATGAILAAAPGAAVVGPAVSGPRSFIGTGLVDHKTREFLNRVMDSSAVRRWSAITVHPYRSPRETPESAVPQLETVREMMREKGIDPERTPLIAGEWGYSTAKHHIDEHKQAAYAVRSLLLAAKERMPFSIWYNWQEMGGDPWDKEHKFGLLRFGSLHRNSLDSLAKPSFRAIEQLSDLLNGYRFDRVIETSAPIMMLRFTDEENSEAFAFWSPDDETRKAVIPLPPGNWKLSPILGESASVSVRTDEKLETSVSMMPVIAVPE